MIGNSWGQRWIWHCYPTHGASMVDERAVGLLHSLAPYVMSCACSKCLPGTLRLYGCIKGSSSYACAPGPRIPSEVCRPPARSASWKETLAVSKEWNILGRDLGCVKRVRDFHDRPGGWNSSLSHRRDFSPRSLLLHVLVYPLRHV